MKKSILVIGKQLEQAVYQYIYNKIKTSRRNSSENATKTIKCLSVILILFSISLAQASELPPYSKEYESNYLNQDTNFPTSYYDRNDNSLNKENYFGASPDTKNPRGFIGLIGGPIINLSSKQFQDFFKKPFNVDYLKSYTMGLIGGIFLKENITLEAKGTYSIVIAKNIHYLDRVILKGGIIGLGWQFAISKWIRPRIFLGSGVIMEQPFQSGEHKPRVMILGLVKHAAIDLEYNLTNLLSVKGSYEVNYISPRWIPFPGPKMAMCFLNTHFSEFYHGPRVTLIWKIY